MLNHFFIVRTKPCATFNGLTLTIWQNKFVSLNNCSIDLYNKDFQTTIHTRLTEFFLHPVLSCFLNRRVNSLMNELEGEWRPCLCEIFISWLHCLNNVIVACLLVFPRFLYCTLLLLVYWSIPFFYSDVVAVFLFICWSC